jgi:DNA-binding transcriptional regulator YiaG
MEDQATTRKQEAADLSALRRDLAVTPETVAAALGVSTRTLFRYETGRIPPKRAMLKVWRDVLARHQECPDSLAGSKSA